VALTVLRDGGGSTQQALAATLEMDGTNIVGLLNDLEAKNLIERRRPPSMTLSARRSIACSTRPPARW
jgi:MarR family transcriptional regulator, lower aerobic nicotinate degradation pathway regulator